MSAPRELVDLFTILGRQVLGQRSTDGAFGAISTFSVEAVRGADYASITRVRETGFQTIGATHGDATANDRIQYQVQSGPCLDAVGHEDAAVLVRDLLHDPRYPVFGPMAAANNAASMLSVRMAFEDPALNASLNLYARQVNAFDEDAQTDALVLATHGAVAVACVVAREHAANLERALVNSRGIGTAVGILMSSLVISSDDAFTLLRVASQNQNRKVADVAADVVVTGTLEMPDPQ